MRTLRLFIGILAFSLLLAACAPAQKPVAVIPTVVTAAPSATPLPQPTAENTPPPPSLPAVESAASLPDSAGYAWVEVVSGLRQPTVITHAGDGSGRLFLVEQFGRIFVYREGQLTEFINLTDRVGTNGSERGLLGLAFHPQYAENGLFFVHYTDQNGDTAVSRFRVSAENANQGDPASEERILSVSQPYANHNGGQLAFGPEGALYIGLGDGGSGGDPLGSGQSLNTLLGKLLRLDVDSGAPYGIPEGNLQGEIWAYGLRNPWRFSFDRATGDLYIADVGQNAWEEINFWPAGAPGGANFGWDLMEASQPFEGANDPSLTGPVTEYSHELGCSVTGGYVYRGAALPEWRGVYLFGDFCSGRVWGLLKTVDTWTASQLFETGFKISTFGEDEAGEVYLADYNGSIYRLEKR